MADRDEHLPDAAPIGAAVVVHPHPGMGGDRHHPLVVAIANGLAARGIAALRVDLRDPNPQTAAPLLEAAAAGFLHATSTDRLALVGYSWGSAVASLANEPAPIARVLIAPPVMTGSLTRATSTPTLVLVPEYDQYGGPEAVAEALAGVPSTAITVEIIENADHFLNAVIVPVAARAVDWLAAALISGG